MYGDTGVTEVDRVMGSVYSADRGVHRHHRDPNNRMPLGRPDATTITLCSIGGADLVFHSRLKVPDGAPEGAVFMHCAPPSRPRQ